ncbi:hypothetical protein WDW86_17150 [Bdellovibrionota bacterium FG-2]
MALPTNIFIGKAKASTPQTKKQFSTHKPWDQPESSLVNASNGIGTTQQTGPEPLTHILIAPAQAPIPVKTEAQPEITPKTNLEQSQNKVGTILEQSQNRPPLNLEQSQNKVGTTDPSIISPLAESQNKVRSQLRTEVGTILEQSQNKVGTNAPFSSVVGLQRRIILFIFESTKVSRDKATSPIAIQNLAVTCKTTAMAAQVTIRRLEKKGFIRRVEFKDGRGGWSRYELSGAAFQELLHFESQNKVGTILEQSQNKVGSQLRTELRTSPSSSSSFLIREDFKTTTTSEPDLRKDDPTKLPPEWEQVNCIPLADYGFGESQLSQIVRDKLLTPEMVQDSIFAFAFDLRVNAKEKEVRGAPLNYFMGILRKGFAYARPANYETPQEAARRKRLELLQREESQRQAEEQQLLELEFSSWKRGQSVAEIVAQLPEHARRPGPVQDSALKNHFVENMWPELQASQSDVDPSEREKIKATIAQSFGEARG